MRICTVADIPDELAQAWLQHLRDFDTAHPGCHFSVLAAAANMSTEEAVDALRIDPSLSLLDVLRRRRQ